MCDLKPDYGNRVRREKLRRLFRIDIKDTNRDGRSYRKMEVGKWGRTRDVCHIYTWEIGLRTRIQ